MAKKILVVEDNADSRFILVTRLRHIGDEIVEAATGPDGVEKSIAEKPDLILMDIGLPGMTGIEAARRIKENPVAGHVPIVAHTAWDPSQWKDQALNAGMGEYLVKPVSMKTLEETIKKFCRD